MIVLNEKKYAIECLENGYVGEKVVIVKNNNFGQHKRR